MPHAFAALVTMGQGQSGESSRHVSTEQLSHELVHFPICTPPWQPSTDLIGSEICETMLHSSRTLLLPGCLQKPCRSPKPHLVPQRRHHCAVPRDPGHSRCLLDYLPDGVVLRSFPLRTRCAGRVGLRTDDNGGRYNDGEIPESTEEGQ